ncbi:3-oxoacyl-ACP reductase FabG [Desulfotignum phosphitoxidans]|jgi:3-oxoacyl-[acyl-carrier protein] reductase|uniref:3-oxoacyl-[acyl-carrier-protein] reductase n=1 Tax=Desulfotignum phosphitoxidans DSM 13687 TaxID=1286635 RepID=S0G387_9BACT|nr:3-oxoacyl-ACP reductase FabG [Desulfotignum phosphitoxidans]EMS81360.1 3-oxoacyl-[acyl-carrier-protein] reductase FabG [Desulfotignum phosphitoxidans DSM 13687]
MTSDIQTPGEVALVTGAGRGIGRAIAVDLARSGRFVYINYKSNATAAKKTLEQVRAAGSDGALLCFDVTNEAAAHAALKTIYKEKGFIDILVNNAGIRDDMLLVRMKSETWQQVMDTNLTGFFNLTKPVVKKMISKRRGRVINITSASGQMGQAGQVNYSASKAGIIGATMALAKEIAKRNITVNAVAPGFIETDMMDGLPLEQIVQSVPAGRLGKPEEVAAAVTFLCSPEAGYITGQVIGINGGLC